MVFHRAVIKLTLILVLAVVGTASAAVKPPRSGSQYQGAAHHVFLQISGRSIEIIAFSFRCDGTKGRISLNDIRLKRSSRGYRFYSVLHGLVTYGDGEPDENAEVRIRGLFTRDAKAVRGRFRVITPRCGNTGRLRWRATRVKQLAP
jgi:hypothetical protein